MPQLGAILNLYALQSDPEPASAGSGALPALPAVLKTLEQNSPATQAIKLPAIHTFVPALGLVSSPGAFGEQLVTSANLLLARNLAIAYGATRLRSSLKLVRVVVDVEGMDVPTLDELSLAAKASASQAKDRRGAKATFAKASHPAVAPRSGLERFLEPLWNTWAKMVGSVRPDRNLQPQTPWDHAERQILAALHARRGRSVWLGSSKSSLSRIQNHR